MGNCGQRCLFWQMIRLWVLCAWITGGSLVFGPNNIWLTWEHEQFYLLFENWLSFCIGPKLQLVIQHLSQFYLMKLFAGYNWDSIGSVVLILSLSNLKHNIRKWLMFQFGTVWCRILTSPVGYHTVTSDAWLHSENIIYRDQMHQPLIPLFSFLVWGKK